MIENRLQNKLLELRPMRIIRKDDLPLGGFAGIVETRMVMNPDLWPETASSKDISKGLGGFIYMATGHFNPSDGAPMHGHENVDIVTLVSSGEVGHNGTNGAGITIKSPGVQVQRAGKGMRHSEFSNKPEKAEFVQLWFAPPINNLEAAHQNFDLSIKDGVKTVLGGNAEACFANDIHCQIGFLTAGSKISKKQSCMAYVFQGTAIANDQKISEGDLVEVDNLELVAGENTGLILISVS